MEWTVPSDPGIVDDNINRAKRVLDLFEPCSDSVIIGDIKLEGRNSGFCFKGLGGFGIAAIIGSDFIPFCRKPFASLRENYVIRHRRLLVGLVCFRRHHLPDS